MRRFLEACACLSINSRRLVDGAESITLDALILYSYEIRTFAWNSRQWVEKLFSNGASVPVRQIHERVFSSDDKLI